MSRSRNSGDSLAALLVAGLFLAGVAAAPPAWAQDAGAPDSVGLSSGDAASAMEMNQAKEYADCMTLARRVPDQALESARAWMKAGGGTPAGHCAAVALIGLERYPEAAASLEKLAGDELKTRPDLAADLYGQASQAWVLAGDNEGAIKDDGLAIKLAPGDPDLRVDRGVILASLARYKEAIDDFTKAHDLAQGRADILVFRATAYRMLKDLKAARADIDQAIKLQPKNPDAYLERGIIRLLGTDVAGAKADWQKAIALGPGTPSAQAAEANLKQLDQPAANPPGANVPPANPATPSTPSVQPQ